MPRLPVSDAELEVLKVLWTAGPSTVRDVAATLRKRRRRLAYNTVLTLLSRLREKGYVRADRRETAYLFRAVVTRDDLAGLEPGGAGRPGVRRDRQPARARAGDRAEVFRRGDRALSQAPRRPYSPDE